jgi:hypothetical protein
MDAYCRNWLCDWRLWLWMLLHFEGTMTQRMTEEVVDMFGFMQNLILCTSASLFLALAFLSPTGAALVTASGLLVGICLDLGERLARPE